MNTMMKEQHLRTIDLGEKMLYIVDNHQYVLPLWGAIALETKKAYELFSIDYHPDTNPPFWLYAYQKAMAIDPNREAALVECFQKKILQTIDKNDLSTLADQMSLMRNDEHIHTAMYMGYLEDYHMINCMEKHAYTEGHHYLVRADDFGKLSDKVFQNAGFELKSIKKQEEKYKPFILDIDLDYFMETSDFEIISQEMNIFKTLVKNADMITCARSVTYFDHLKRENFDSIECEEKLIQLLKIIKLENA